MPTSATLGATSRAASACCNRIKPTTTVIAPPRSPRCGMPTPIYSPHCAPMAPPVGPVMGQRASDNNIRYAQSYVGHAIDMLHQDQHDYNGYRAKAVQQ